MAVLGMNEGTSKYINFDLVGTVNTQVVGVGYGTINTIGTLPAITVGTVPGIGTITNVGSISSIGTMPAISVGNATGGTLDLVKSGTVTRVEGGSIAVTAGTTVVTGGSIAVTAGTSVVTGGSIVVTTGTVNAGTLTNLVSGTINSATAVLNSGTINVATATVTGGSIVVTTGTVTTGTVQMLNNIGTFPSGTQIGTINAANGFLNITTTGMTTVGMAIATGGSWDGNLTFDGCIDGNNWVNINAYQPSIGGYGTATSGLDSAAGTFIARVGGFNFFRVRESGQRSQGSAVVTLFSEATDSEVIPGIVANGIKTNSAQPTMIGGGLDTGGTAHAFYLENTTSSLRTMGPSQVGGSPSSNLFPFPSAGTDSGGTVRTMRVDASGYIHIVTESGTVKNDGRPARNILSYGTTFGGTAAAYATLVGSASVGAGTATWVTDVSVNNPAGNITCLVGFGTALSGSSVLLKGTFGTTSGVGQQKSYPLPVNAGMTNQDLVAYISGAGTIDVNVSYFISA